jgi:hypothetical protein
MVASLGERGSMSNVKWKGFAKPKAQTVISVISLLFALFSLAISYLVYVQNRPVSSVDILDTIRAEAKYSKNHDPEAALDLFEPDAVVRDAGARPPQIWSGTTAIKERYEELPTFLELDHIDLTLSLDAAKEFARVRGSTIGEYLDTSGKRIVISSVNGEEWALRKEKGSWKIVSFSYDVF